MLVSEISALDAVTAGATAVEDDISVDSVGTGGLPDSSGRVSLDACVMESPSRAGAVCYLRRFPNAAKVARSVMEHTIHVMLAGDGAEAFAQSQGYSADPGDLLTPASRAAWEKWKLDGGTKACGEPGITGQQGRLGQLPSMDVEDRYAQALKSSQSSQSLQAKQAVTPAPTAQTAQTALIGKRDDRPLPGHDTVCLLARDTKGKLAGVCTTSGLGFKLPGRVGDSPIIGHGLYVDQGVGAATATGNGELIMGVCGSFLAVELMRQGRTPAEALTEVMRRVLASYEIKPQHQVAMMALSPAGVWACASLRPGFSVWVSDALGTRNIQSQQTMLAQPAT